MDRYRNCPCRNHRPSAAAAPVGAAVRNAVREQSREDKYDVPAISFVTSQPFGDLYSPEEGLNAGTIFRGLDKPLGCGGCGR